MARFAPPRVKAARWGLLFAGALAALIVIGSRNLHHFDAAPVGYTFATLFATFGITYRYTMWLNRPPTRMYWRRGWQIVVTPGLLGARRPAAGLAPRFPDRLSTGPLRGAPGLHEVHGAHQRCIHCRAVLDRRGELVAAPARAAGAHADRGG